MVHQSKTIVDAAADAGLQFVVHLCIFGNGRTTDPHFAWHEMVERYIEGSGVAWSHIHPHLFMDNLLTSVPVVNGRFYWFMGDKRVGWIAADDLAAVCAQVLADGRVVAGVHYTSDTEAGLALGDLLFAQLETKTEFQKDLTAAATKNQLPLK
jgi:NAD(P)H dehydrogenase (quinone)